MSNQVTNSPDHDAIVSMLPWFVNRTLEEHQRILVSSHLASCAECRRELTFLETLNESVRNSAQDSHDLHADVEGNFSDVMNRIDTDDQKNSALASGKFWLQRQLDEVFKLPSALPFPQWGATALAGILVAILGFQWYSGQSDDHYSVLSSSDIETPSMRLSVEMSTAGQKDKVQSVIQRELDKLGTQIDMEMNTDGRYVVVIKDTISVNELSELVTDLENSVQIERVEILP